MRPGLLACVALLVAGLAFPAQAGEFFWHSDQFCYWCIRDAIYADFALIARLEANPDVDEAVKGPAITAARADIHRLRALLGPLQQGGPEPCCYARQPLYVR